MDIGKRESPTPAAGSQLSESTRTSIREPRVIRNKDIRTISEIRPLQHEIESLEKRREWQHDRMYNVTRRLTGMPGARGGHNGIDTVLAALSDIDDEYTDKIIEYTRRVKKAERILQGIQNATMRAFVTAYYVDSKSKAEIMREMRMTEWGFNRARDAIEQSANMETVVWHEKYVFYD